MVSYSVCVGLYVQDLVGGKAVFPELFVGLGVVSNLYSLDLGSQDSISTLTLWLSWRQSCMWVASDCGICKTDQSDQWAFQNLKQYKIGNTVFVLSLSFCERLQRLCYSKKIKLFQWYIFVLGDLLDSCNYQNVQYVFLDMDIFLCFSTVPHYMKSLLAKANISQRNNRWHHFPEDRGHVIQNIWKVDDRNSHLCTFSNSHPHW